MAFINGKGINTRDLVFQNIPILIVIKKISQYRKKKKKEVKKKKKFLKRSRQAEKEQRFAKHNPAESTWKNVENVTVARS